MKREDINPEDLEKCLRLALDVVMAHRIARGLSLDRGRVTLMREVIEEHTLLALERIDLGSMPVGWSWKLAAESIAVQVALSIVNEQKNETKADDD